jgi:hypothetical protein
MPQPPAASVMSGMTVAGAAGLIGDAGIASAENAAPPIMAAKPIVSKNVLRMGASLSR